MSNILVIDDEEYLREVLSRFLTSVGHVVRAAVDGYEAAGMLDRDPPDWVVTDIVMPRKDGFETIKDLRRDHPGIKIIAMAGDGQMTAQKYLRLAKALGADYVLEKPLSGQEILDIIDAGDALYSRSA